jgi:hypothetical protein
VFLAASGTALADDTRLLEIYKCKMKDGVKMEQVKANNVRWLANTRKIAGTDDINSYALQPKVGDFDHFIFIDSYPDLATWAKSESAGDTEESKAINAAFDEMLDCEKNRLYESTKH